MTRELFDASVARSIEPFRPIADELAAYAGRSISPELETSYRLVVHEGRLVAQHSRRDDLTMKPVQKDSFAGSNASFLHKDFRFHREPGGRIAGFRVSFVTVRGVRFDRHD